MQRDARAFLWDVSEAAQPICIFTTGLDVAGYANSPPVSSAVKRKFEIIGDPVSQLPRWLLSSPSKPLTYHRSWLSETS